MARRPVTTNGRNNGNGEPQGTTEQNGHSAPIQPPTNTPPATGTTRTIALSNAGTLTLSVNVNLLALKGRDREFVFRLIDQIEAFETESESGSTVAA